MKKKLSVLLIVVMTLSATFLFAGCGDKGSDGGAEGETYDFSIAHLQAEGTAAADSFNFLAKELEEKSEGRIKVTIHGGGTMAGSDPELAELARAGTVQMVPVPTHALSALVNIPEYKIFEMPYLFSDWDEIYTVLDSDLAQEWTKPLQEKAGVKVYGGLVKGWLSVGLKNENPLEAPSDLKGKKIRTMSTDMQMGLISALGGSPTSVAYGELYTAIQQGTVDGSLTATNLYVADRFGEVIDSLSILRATAHFHLPTVNLEWYNALPEDLQKVFDEAMDAYLGFAREAEKKADTEAIEQLQKDMNVTVREYSDEELAPFRKAAHTLFTKNYDSCGEGVMDSVLEVLGKKESEIFK
ncbi:tripartite ATP-independent transporter DctP family solute receptor [Clostridiales Family XIII bacterium PM5-7]